MKQKKQDMRRLLSLASALDKAKAEADSVRDRIRDLIAEADSIADSFEEGSEYLRNAAQNIKDAVEEMSKFV